MNLADAGQQCVIEGPMISGTMTVGQGVSMKPLPGISDLPVGAPGNPNTQGVPEASVLRRRLSQAASGGLASLNSGTSLPI